MPKTGIKVKMKPPHPGIFIITELIDELGMDIPQIAAMLGVAPHIVADLVDARIRLTPEVALRLEKAFDLKMSRLLDIQAWYEEVQMRAKWDEIDAQPYLPAWEANAAQLAELSR